MIVFQYLLQILGNRTQLIISSQIMNLLKQNFITISISQLTLSQNFQQIQQEFRRIKREIVNIKDNSQMMIDRINKIDPEQCIQYVQPHQKHFPTLLSSVINNNQTEKQLSKINGSPQFYESNTIIQATQYLDQIFPKQQRVGKENKRKVQSRESEISLAKKTRKNQKQKNSNDTILRQFIKDIQIRLVQLQRQKEKGKERVQNIQKDNQRIRRVLGFRDEKSKCRNKKTEKKIQEFPKTELLNRSQNDQQRLGTELNIQNKTNNQQKIELVVQQNNFMTSLNKSFEQLKQYVKSKMRIVQQSLEKFLLEIRQSKSELNQIKERVNQNEYRLTKLNEQNSDNLDRSRTRITEQKIKKPSDSIYKKTKTLTSEGHILNDTVQSYKNYYQDKIIQIFEQMDKIRHQYYNIAQKLTNEGQIGNDQQKLKSLAIKMSQIKSPSEQKLRKQLSSLKREHKRLRDEFNLLIGDVNLGNNETRTFIIKPNQNKQDWKDVTQKIFKLKQELLSYVKDLQNKINLNNDMTIVIQQIQVAISQCKILIGKKVNFTDFQKYNKRIQNRLNNFIRQMCQKEGIMNQQQALIAKQPWFCLSCDSQIKNYTPKVGRPICNQRMTGKKVNPQSHMVRRPQLSKLPSVH